MIRQGLTSKVIRTATITILLAATLCRASWATQLYQHDTAPLVVSTAVATEHGHYHTPLLGHLHADSSGISENDHLFIHVVLKLDHPVLLVTLPERPQTNPGSSYPRLAFNLLSPYQADLYRPPR